MKLEGHIYCERLPDCDTHAHIGPDKMGAGHLPPGWIRTTEYGGLAPAEQAFCGWDCLMKAAATIEPPETLEL